MSVNNVKAVLARVDRELNASVDRLFTLLQIQSISTDPAYAAHCRKAAEHVAADLDSLGFNASLRPTAGHPVVIGKGANGGNGQAPRVLFYGHYDVQPVDPLDLWHTPPFEPRIHTLNDGRKIIVARGACDDKGQAMTFVEACRAFKAVTGKLPLDITMLIEGEEECGSKHLFGFVRDHAQELKCDLALVCDTGMWDAATPSITTSLRGLVYEEVRLTCADRATCIRACSAAPREIQSMCWPKSWRRCTGRTDRSLFPVSTRVSRNFPPTSKPILPALISRLRNSSRRSD